MSIHLTAGQRALLEAELQTREAQLDQRLAEHHGGLTRAEHARELLANRDAIPVCDQIDAAIDGRSGLVATQGG